MGPIRSTSMVLLSGMVSKFIGFSMNSLAASFRSLKSMGLPSTSNWLLALISTSNTFRSLMGGGAGSSFGMGGGRVRPSPASVLMVVVIKKKMRSKKAISANDPALTSGVSLLAIGY